MFLFFFLQNYNATVCEITMEESSNCDSSWLLKSTYTSDQKWGPRRGFKV